MAKKIYLSPSNQNGNKYATGNTNEMEQCNKIAAAAETALKRCGFTVKRAPKGQNMTVSINESNAWKADMHIPIHTNAFNNKTTGGTMIMVYSNSGENAKAAKAIKAALDPLTPGKDYAIQTRTDLAELRQTTAIAVYCECEFHDTKEGASFIIANTGKIGEAIAKGVCSYYGVKYVASSSGGSASTTKEQMYRVRKAWNDEKSQIGAFTVLQNAKNMADKNKGYYVFDKDGKKIYTPASSGSTSLNTVTVKGKDSCIRDNARCDAKTLKTVKVGTKLTWLADDGWGWSQVSNGIVIGWIQNSRLSGKSGLTTWRRATCNGTGVQVRKQPTTASAAVRVIGNGTQFDVTCLVKSKDPKHTNNWIMTGSFGEDYYIYYGDYISIGGARK